MAIKNTVSADAIIAALAGTTSKDGTVIKSSGGSSKSSKAPAPVAAPAPFTLPPTGNLKTGSRGDDVKSLQQALNSQGYNLAVDGIYGPKTEAAVRAFQTASKIATDGIVGPNTTSALNSRIIPSTPIPQNAALVAPVPPMQIPQVEPPQTDITGAVAGTQALDTYLKTLMKQQEQYQSEIKAYQAAQAKQTESFLSKMLASKSPTEVRNETFEQIGVNPANFFAEEQARIKEINTLTEEYNAVVAAKDTQIAAAYDRLGSNNFINNQIAQIERNAAPKLNMMSANVNAKAATLQALQGSFAEAQQFVNQAVNDATADLKYNMQMFETFYQVNQDVIDRLDRKYQTAFEQSLNIAKTMYDDARADKETIGELMIQNPQAGILITDSLDEAFAKVGVNPMAPKGEIFGTSETGYSERYYDAASNSWKTRRLSGGTGGSGGSGSSGSASSAPIGLIQTAVNSGMSLEEAILDVAGYYESMGVQVDQKTLTNWKSAAKNITAAPAPAPATTTKKPGFLGGLFGGGTKTKTTTTPTVAPRPVPSMLKEATGGGTSTQASVGSFFSNLFGD